MTMASKGLLIAPKRNGMGAVLRVDCVTCICVRSLSKSEARFWLSWYASRADARKAMLQHPAVASIQMQVAIERSVNGVTRSAAIRSGE